jgi:hypothetical protein
MTKAEIMCGWNVTRLRPLDVARITQTGDAVQLRHAWSGLEGTDVYGQVRELAARLARAVLEELRAGNVAVYDHAGNQIDEVTT